MSTNASDTVKLTAKSIANYVRLSIAKREAEKHVRDLDKQMSEVKEGLIAHATRYNGSVKTCGYQVTLTPGGRYPKWKEAFVEANGEAVAERIIEATEPSVKLEVEKV